jgi:hypothetical protein
VFLIHWNIIIFFNFKFEYIFLFFQKFQKFFRNYKINQEMYSNFNLQILEKPSFFLVHHNGIQIAYEPLNSRRQPFLSPWHKTALGAVSPTIKTIWLTEHFLRHWTIIIFFILKFEYIFLFFQKFQKFFRNYKINQEMYSNFNLQILEKPSFFLVHHNGIQIAYEPLNSTQ